MKVYIPFNSNDFNSIFTTLSISPNCFYPRRKFSFKRASVTFLNDNEEFLIGFEKPIFHHKDLDKDYGLPVLLEVEVLIDSSELSAEKSGNKYLLIDDTIYLFENFKLIFRNEKELNETFSKTLKSIETKFTDLAKRNSVTADKNFYINELPKPDYPIVNKKSNEITFQNERKLNRILGVILGSAIAFSNSTAIEWLEVSNSFRSLNNNLSLYLNRIGENNDLDKKPLFDIIEKVTKACERIESLDEAIMLESDIKSDLLNLIKQTKIFDTSIYNLIIEGLLASTKIDFPIVLKLEKLKRIINHKYNSKYPSNYIEKINGAYSELRDKIESEISLSRISNTLSEEDLIIPHVEQTQISFKELKGLAQLEKKYLECTLGFFIQSQRIFDIETFFSNRKEILIELANHFKNSIIGFDDSGERRYLIELLKSFDSLREGFKISTTKNEVLKSIAILFTSGRDLIRFIDCNEKEEIKNSLIYYSLWGAIYGASTFPKTMTGVVTESQNSIQILLSAFKRSLDKFVDTYVSESKEVVVQSTFKSELKENLGNNNDLNNELNESAESYKRPISAISQQILDLLSKKKYKLSELVKLFKPFKKQSDVESLIKEELADEVILLRNGKTIIAERKYNN